MKRLPLPFRLSAAKPGLHQPLTSLSPHDVLLWQSIKPQRVAQTIAHTERGAGASLAAPIKTEWLTERTSGSAIASQKSVYSHRSRVAESISGRGSAEDMRKKTAFSESHFWENVGMLVFVLAGLVGLWYMMTNVIAW